MKIEGVNKYLLAATAALGLASLALGLTALGLKRDIVQVCQPFYTKNSAVAW